MVLVTEQMQIITIWAVKVCLLIMYNRLTYVITCVKTPVVLITLADTDLA
jgi:hypothetical protein